MNNRDRAELVKYIFSSVITRFGESDIWEYVEEFGASQQEVREISDKLYAAVSRVNDWADGVKAEYPVAASVEKAQQLAGFFPSVAAELDSYRVGRMLIEGGMSQREVDEVLRNLAEALVDLFAITAKYLAEHDAPVEDDSDFDDFGFTHNGPNRWLN